MAKLPTLLHQTAAGPARDKRLVEWLVQMGALIMQRSYCRDPPAPGTLPRGMTCGMIFNQLAVLSAVEAGMTDIARILLSADHLRDMNTPTFHTKETLLHLAVKNGHHGQMYEMLLAMGADARRPDANGNYVYDLTSDPAMKKHIRFVIDAQSSVAAKDTSTLENRIHGPDMEVQSGAAYERLQNATADRLRRKLERQRETERTARQAAATKLARALAPSVQAASVMTGSQATKSSKRKNKKKHKHKKQQVNRDEGEAVDDIGAHGLQHFLLGNEYSPFARNGKSSFSGNQQVQVEEQSEDKRDPVDELAAALSTLKMQNNVMDDEHLSEVVKIIDKLRGIYIFTDDAQQNSLTRFLREEKSQQAFRAIHLLNKYHRQMPEPPVVSRLQLREKEPERDQVTTTSPLQGLQRRCETNPEWVNFVLNTVQVLSSCNRFAHACELLEVFEKRLLKLKQRSIAFRSWVQMYAKTRELAALDRMPSTTSGREQLEWYLTPPADVEDDETLLDLDLLYGCRSYALIKCTSPLPSIRRLSDVLAQEGPQEIEFVFIGSHILSDSDSKTDFEARLSHFKATAAQCGWKYDPKKSQFMVESIEMFGFGFSSRGIIRKR